MIMYIALPSIPRLFLGKHNNDSTKKIKNIEISQPAQIIKDSSPTHFIENEGKRLALVFSTKGKLTTGTNLLWR